MKFKKKIVIQNKVIEYNKCFIVAEISANHCGKLSTMKSLILKLKKAGADAIKIQAYEASTITIDSKKKDFRIKKNNTWAKYNTLFSLYKTAQTPFSWYPKIFNFCKKNKIIIFASVFDEKSLSILEKLKCPAYKIASPEITDISLISTVSKTKKPIIISNGLASESDLKLAINTVRKQKNPNLVVLKCTSSYPAPINEINLLTMKDINKKYKTLVGYSDHTNGYQISINAASLGACLIEKHVGLKNMKSVDSFFSLNTEEFKEMVKIIRDNEIANGNINYNISKSSIKNLNGRRSLYVVKDIKKGEKFTKKNIRSIRPTFGMHPKFLSQFLNKACNKSLRKGSRLLWKHLKKS